MTEHDDLALALELAELADGIALRHFRSERLAVETKADLTPVTAADREIERVLRERLALVRPHEGVVGEEFGEDGAGSARWILDPIDGTKNFSRGLPVFATLLALERERELAVAVVSAPALHRRWWAARGQGAFADGQPIQVSRVARLEDAVISASLDESRGELLAPLGRGAWHTRSFGDFWQHVLVAEGAVDVAVDPVVHLWDVAAIQLIVEEAGGRVSDLRGKVGPDRGSALSTNGLLHDQVLALLRQ